MMNNVTLDEEEEGGLALDVTKGDENHETLHGVDAKLCLMGRFITEGVVDFPSMKQTLAALWRPGRGVHIRKIDVNLYKKSCGQKPMVIQSESYNHYKDEGRIRPKRCEAEFAGFMGSNP